MELTNSLMEVKLEQKDASDWVYRGEGAVNLVLAYVGSSPVFIGKVMRIQKVVRNRNSDCVKNDDVLTEEERLLWSVSKELVSAPMKELSQLIYVQHIICPLLGSDYVDAGVCPFFFIFIFTFLILFCDINSLHLRDNFLSFALVYCLSNWNLRQIHVPVSREFLESIEKKVTSQRPAWRVDAAKIDTQRDYVIIMSDHSLFPPGIHKARSCISVEIKPKCGFLPESRFIAERNAIKRIITRYRMHQILKLQQHEISEISQYDPLDIFSNSKEKIHKAVNDLYITPQNNFRVFLNGSLILGGLGGGTNKTSILVEEAFEDALKGVIEADDGLRATSFLELVAETLYSSQVLDRLVEVQKLDNYDIEGAIHAYYDIISQPCMVCRELDAAGLPNIYTFLHSIPMDERLKIVRDYLISATAKDCSLMISFRPREDGDLGSPYSSIYLQSTNQTFDYKVNFLDLDLKPLKKMKEYYEKDKKIVDLYARMEENHTEDGYLSS